MRRATRIPGLEMTPRQVAKLAELADRMIAQAQAAKSERIFSATGFAQADISILHQQSGVRTWPGRCCTRVA
jgi:hypothetical protein